MPSGVVSVGVLADFAELIEQSDAAGLSVEAFAGRVVTSARTASRAMADYAKAQGASADEAKAAAAETAAAWDATYGSMSKSSKDAGNAALATSRLFKESADEQTAAYAKAAEAQKALETQQKAASDAAVAAAAKTAAAAEESAARVTAAGKKLASIGKWSLFGGAAAVALSVKSAADLQTAMERLHTQAGVSQQSVKSLTSSVMGIAGSLATSPDALAQSLYHVESGGIHGANALKVMATAAREAKVSGADLTDTTTALTATVYSGISGAQDYAKAMGLLNATVGAGDMTFQDLNEALGGPMLATVKGYGLSLKDVGAALATFGDDNIRGADAATQLRMAVQYMAKPAATAGPILQALGLSTTSFADAMSKGGLLPALQLLHDRLVAAKIPANDYAQVISDIFSKKGASGVTILENSLGKLESKYTEVGKGTGQVNQDWDAWNKTLQADMDHLRATVEALADKFGTYLIPKLESVAHAASDVISWFEKNRTAAEALAGVITGVLGLAVTVFAYQKAVAFVNGVKGMMSGIDQLAGKLMSLAAPSAAADADIASVGTTATATEGEVAAAGSGMVTAADGTAGGVDAALGATGVGGALVALGIGVTELAEHWHGEMDDIKNDALSIVAPIENAFQSIISTITGTVSHGVNAVTRELSGGVTGRAIEGWGGSSGQNVGYGTGPARRAAGAPAMTWRQDLASDYAGGAPGLTAGVDRRLSHGTVAQFNAWMAAHGDKDLEYRATTGSSGGLALPGVSNTATTANPVQLLNFLQKALGLTKNQAAGIVGNIQVESAGSFAGNIVQGGGRASTIAAGDAMGTGGGYGLAQWTDPGRQANLAALAKRMGLQQDSVKVQEAFIVQELKGSYANALQNLKGTSTAAQAATVIQNEYEGPKSLTASLAERQQDATALAGGATVTPATSTSSSGSSILDAIQNLGGGAKLPAVLQTAAATNQATQLSDQTNKVQAVGQAQVTVLQAINQRLQDAGTAVVQKLANLQTAANDHAAAQVTRLKDLQALTDQRSAIQVAKIQDATTAIQDGSAITVAAITASATKIADVTNAAATLVQDNAQTNADTISEKGLYGLNLVAQKLQVTADQTKAYWDQQIATAQAQLDSDQSAANVANAQAALATAQVTATQDMKVLLAQQHLDSVTLKEDARVARAQQHLDAVTIKEDARANAAKAHLDAVTVTQDNRILRATQHADAVQLSVDTTKIGPAQIAVDMNANASKTVQATMQNQLNLATASGSEQINAAQQQLAGVTANANSTIAGAQNAYQDVQNTVNKVIQAASNQSSTAQNAASNLIQQATDTYQSVQDAANQTIANVTQTQASTAAGWAGTLATDQGTLATTQGAAALGEAQASGAVTNEQAIASTQFAGSGFTVNVYGVSGADPTAIGDAASWAIRSSGVAS